MRRTSIERYAANRGLAVVMPRVDRSYYADMVHGLDYWTFIRDEVPARAEAFFPLRRERSHRFVAGLSMGGYGALKLAFDQPDRFAAAASLSGAVDPPGLSPLIGDERYREFNDMFGSEKEFRGSVNDLYAQADALAQSGRAVPRLYQCCGTEDFLIEHNRAFRDHLKSCGLDVLYEEEPGFHEWAYWDAKIQRVLKWLPLPS
jgi:S-formylglutathione hydrolase FrmB